MKRYIKSLVILLILLCPNGLRAQENITHFLRRVPQPVNGNPGRFLEENAYIMIPPFSNYQAGGFNSFAFTDIIRHGTGEKADSLVMDLDNLESVLKDKNHLGLNMTTQLLGFGFRVKRNFFSFGIANRTIGTVTYPKDLLLLRQGNWDMETDQPINHDIRDMGINATSFNEIALGWTYQLNDQISFGLRMKYLMGIGNIKTNHSQLAMVTNPDDYSMTLSTDMEIYSSFPMVITTDPEKGTVDEVEMDDDAAVSDFFSTKNSGFAMDLGVEVMANEKVRVSASLLDLGFIKWGNNGHLFSSKDSFDFQGEDVSDVITDDKDAVLFENITDSIKDSFTVEQATQSYKSSLGPELRLGADYLVTECLSLSVLSRNRFLKDALQAEVSLAGSISPTRWFSSSLSYTYSNMRASGLGLGMVFDMGPLQMVMATDNIMALNVYKTQSANFMFGLTWVFGRSKEKNL